MKVNAEEVAQVVASRPTGAIKYLLDRYNTSGEVNSLEVVEYIQRLESVFHADGEKVCSHCGGSHEVLLRENAQLREELAHTILEAVWCALETNGVMHEKIVSLETGRERMGEEPVAILDKWAHAEGYIDWMLAHGAVARNLVAWVIRYFGGHRKHEGKPGVGPG